MTDNDTSGAPAATPPAPVAGSDTQPFGAFGSTRGSGLNRGKKRPSAPASSPAPVANAADYKPSSLEVITAKSEYKNPFAPEPEAPAVIAPVPASAPAATAQRRHGDGTVTQRSRSRWAP